MIHRHNNIRLIKSGGFLKQSISKGSALSLLLQKEGLEIIHHHVKDGGHWVVGPVEGWDGLEFVYLLSGSLSWMEGYERKIAYKGDHLIMDPILEDTLFTSHGDTSFLYISSSSQPVFDLYDSKVKEFMDLAIAVEEKDGYTAEHCHRIMELSIKVGEKLALSSEELYLLHIGSFLHDVGKIKIPDSILNKPGKLTPKEYEMMKKHTVFGSDLLINSGITELKKAAYIVEQHHERLNGSGYPFGLKNNEISLSSAIVGVVDSFDAMTSVRVYSKGRSREEALEEIKRESGKLFHPDVVDAFLLTMS
ncbi:HD-GYP domain-containing protein [Bacillus sp. BRMEA1]|uniref:HD-GYP domain-containing protein n=1 Tax=Neobacillus endophyticus TaxID=2738405 RepID=UPI0015673E34|nr:HD-GYP domain-containing protein [Neobacillus endophyticus]NRD78958.1 HD-GYP domain-containing protein [Neobacillus endophyticus]